MYFKSFLKIFKAQIPMLAIYLGIFLGIAVINIKATSNDETKGYKNYKIPVAIVDNDNSELSDALEKYISKYAPVYEIDETEEGMEDALFQRIVEYIILIPENFEEDLLTGNDVQLGSKQVPDAYSAVYVENLLNQYLSTLKTYYATAKEGTDITEILAHTNETMEQSVQVELNVQELSDVDKVKSSAFDFGAYIVMACIMWGVVKILSIFFEKNIADRIDISPVSSLKRNLMLVGYSLFFTVIMWLLIILAFTFVFGTEMLTFSNMIRCINMFTLSLVALAIGFVISILVKSKNGQGAVVNTIALGFSFISGVFVQMEYISEEILRISSFQPVYWYVKANELITEHVGDSLTEYGDAFECMGVQLLFFIAIISVGLVIKRQSGNKQKGITE